MVSPNRDFGNAGALWTAVPTTFNGHGQGQWPDSGEIETHLLGATATGVHLAQNGVPCLVAWQWTMGSRATPHTRVLLFRFFANGSWDEWQGRLGSYNVLTEPERMGEPLASCSGPGQSVAVLVREVGTDGSTQYRLIRQFPHLFPTSTGPHESLPIPTAWLHPPQGVFESGNAKLAFDTADVVAAGRFVIASSLQGQLRVTVVQPLGPAQAYDFRLGETAPLLAGLVRLDIASVRLQAGAISIAFTAHRNAPGAGGVSQGAILRLLPDGTPAPSFGENGLWVSPLTQQHRAFLCAGEFSRGLVGVEGSNAIAFAVAPGGAGGEALDATFGTDGEARIDLGGPLASPLAAQDPGDVYIPEITLSANGGPGFPGFGTFDPAAATVFEPQTSRVIVRPVYLFARRTSDGTIVGCRFEPELGRADDGFGANGVVTLGFDGQLAQPAGIAVAPPRILVAATRQQLDVDCDRIPTVVALNRSTGARATDFGAGGFALHSSIGAPAHVASDGSAVFTVRHRTLYGDMSIRRVDPQGIAGREVAIRLPRGGKFARITTMHLGSDGSLFVSGMGERWWVAKLTAANTLATDFGTDGQFQGPAQSNPDWAYILGLRADGKLVVRDSIGWVYLLDARGRLDQGFGNAGRVELQGYVHTLNGLPVTDQSVGTYLQEDGSILCTITGNGRNDRLLALRRLTAAGAFDTSFGLRDLSLGPAPSGSILRLGPPPAAGYGRSDRTWTVGCAWLGGALYTVGTGVVGGAYNPFTRVREPEYSWMFVVRFTADGDVDANAQGTPLLLQKYGLEPDLLDWLPSGVLRASPTSCIVYGAARGVRESTVTISDGSAVTSRIPLPQAPAIFRVGHPDGIDFSFGDRGAARMPTREFQADCVGGAIVAGSRVCIACVDRRAHPEGKRDRPVTTFGGLAQLLL